MTGRELVEKYGQALIGAVVKDSYGVPLLITEVAPGSGRPIRGVWVTDFPEAYPCILNTETCFLLSFAYPHPHLLDRVAQAQWAHTLRRESSRRKGA